MVKTIKINGVTFELIIPRKEAWEIKSGFYSSLDTIYECYKKPSVIKQEIWKEWHKWAHSTEGVKSFFISGYNCMQFGIEGRYEDENAHVYNLHITRDHNRAILIR